ncbi:MAG TPA: hypothetical protein VFT56_14005 [Sphingomonas sp.]|nr:hypothetical protein [Sphingomonas sp.]
MQKRPAAEYWGLDRRQNLAVGLLEIAMDAQAWSASYRRDGGGGAHSVSNRALANAIQMVCCLWLEEGCPLATADLDREMREGFRDKKTRASTVFEDELLDDICRRSGFGGGLMRSTRELVKKRPRRGEEGYSARCKAHLWFSAEGDDLGRYQEHQARAVADNLAARRSRGGFPPQASGINSWTRSHAMTMTLEVEAAYCVRDSAMMITSHGLDPMRSFLARPPSKRIEHDEL